MPPERADTHFPTIDAMKKGLSVRLAAFASMGSTQIYKDRRFFGLIAMASIVVVASTVMPSGKNAEAVTTALTAAPVFDLTRDDLYLIDPDVQNIRTVKFTLKSGQNLGPLLQKQGLSPGTAYKVTQAFSTVFPPRNIRAGQSFHLSFNGQDFTDMAFKPNTDHTVFVARKGSTFEARDIAAELRFEQMVVSGTIENSLYLDANSLGAPDKVIVQFANIYEYSVDFQRDIQPGDAF